MIQSPKVLWGEGLFLRPQHFQQQDAYHEWRLTQASRALHPHAWGVRHLKLDADALQTGVLRGNADEQADDSLDIKALLRSGALQPTETFVEGLEAAPQAFVDLFKGANLGKLVVRV